MTQCKIYKHKISGELLRLHIGRKSQVNTYTVVDIGGNPIVERRSWSTRPAKQNRIVTGFENLELIK